MSRPLLHRESASGNGPFAFFVHGLLSSRVQWRPNLVALVRHVRPVLIDLWGHGLSPSPPDDDHYTVAAYIEQFELIRQSLRASPVVMIAHSFGAGLAMQYAVRHPQHVRALVVTNSVTAFADRNDASMKAALEHTAREVATGGLDALRALPMHPRRGRRLPDSLRTELVAQADAVEPAAIIRATRITAPELSTLHDLERIQCPVLLVNGRRESGFQRYRDIAEKRMPRCEVVDLDAGHAVNLEDPTGFDRVTAAFLARVLDGDELRPS